MALWVLVKLLVIFSLIKRFESLYSMQFLSAQKHLTIIDSLAQTGLIPEPIVSYFISRLVDGKNNGQVTFGGMDTSKFDPVTLVTMGNISPKGFWEAPLDGLSVDGNDLGLINRTAILDTGIISFFLVHQGSDFVKAQA